MIALLSKCCTTLFAKGCFCSAAFHVAVVGLFAVVFHVAPHLEMSVFGTQQRTRITLSVILLEPEPPPDETPELSVEVMPERARIGETQYVLERTLARLPEFSVQLTEGPPTRPVPLPPPQIQRRRDRLPTEPSPTHRVAQLPRRSFDRVLSVPRATPPSVNLTETTRLPVFEANRPPVYPPEAYRRALEGMVLLRVHIAADGRVTEVEVVQTSGYAVLDGAAINAVRTWRARPALRAGKPIQTTVKLPIRFKLR